MGRFSAFLHRFHDIQPCHVDSASLHLRAAKRRMQMQHSKTLQASLRRFSALHLFHDIQPCHVDSASLHLRAAKRRMQMQKYKTLQASLRRFAFLHLFHAFSHATSIPLRFISVRLNAVCRCKNPKLCKQACDVLHSCICAWLNRKSYFSFL